MILVTGATGKVGGEVVRQLHAKGVPVRAFVRSPEKARSLLPAGVELAEGDLSDAASLERALAGAEKLFLLSAPDPRQTEWDVAAIEAAKRVGVRYVVKLSAIGASEDAPVMLARWHWAAEEALKASGLPYTILQPTFFMHNLLMFADSVRASGAIHAPVNGRAAYVHVSDIAAVGVAALTEAGHEGKTYVVTGSEALSYPEMAEKIAAATGKPVTYVEVPKEPVRDGMVAAGMPAWFADDMIALYDILNAGYAETPTDVVAAVAKKEPIRFDQFAREYAAAFGGAPAESVAAD
jgi:uncharacterized protein YbjT (DUF2867 family)